MRLPLLGAVGWAVLLVSARAAGAQALPQRFTPIAPAPALASETLTAAREFPPAVAFLASAVAPGAGQYALGVGRWVPYAAVEAWSWVTYLRRERDFSRLERRYRELASEVARRVGTEPERVGPWAYYEAMEDWVSSGAFDVDPRREGIQPETDVATFNGNQWALARAIHFPATGSFPPGTPEYEAALAYYRRTAIQPEFAWSWGDNDLEQQSYRELIRRTDEANRGATRALSLILANHVVSAVDALIAARLATSGDAGRLRLQGGWDPQREALVVGGVIPVR